jgi:hypothetical protein
MKNFKYIKKILNNYTLLYNENINKINKINKINITNKKIKDIDINILFLKLNN